VSPHTGVIRDVAEVLCSPGEIPLVAVSCETGDGELLRSGPVSRVGNGSGRSREAAQVAALGEAVERYSAAAPSDPGKLVLGTAQELHPEAVPPDRFALFSDGQYEEEGFPYGPFTGVSRVTWTEGFSVPGGERALLPAQLVYLGDRWRSDEQRIGPSTSNGLACHATLEEAVLAGLFELVERDAFMIVWSNRLSLPRLRWDADESLVAFEARYLKPTGLQCSAVDLSGFWEVPTVLGVVRGGPETAALGVGACSAPTVQEAVMSALDEACRVQAWASDLRFRAPNRTFSPDCSDVRDFDDHVHYYADHTRAAAADFLDRSPVTRDVGEVAALEGPAPGALIDTIAALLHAGGVSTYAVDVTADDVRAAALSVAKVVAPELCPLDADHRTRFLGGRRLYEAAARLNLGPVVGRVNPDPHPFP
jgi:ribosomal protein S12 methylthiotransferase accessory factor